MPRLNQWGVWEKIPYQDFEYIISVSKHQYFVLAVPWFCIHITAKTAKKRPYGKHTAMFTAIGKTFNMEIMRKLESSIKWYLNVWEPRFIAIGAFEIDHERRLKLYLKRLEKMGYVIKEYINSLEDGQDYYILERKNKDGNVLYETL